MVYRSLIRPLLFRMDPERAHHLALKALRWAGRFPLNAVLSFMFENRVPSRPVQLWGMTFRNPVGLAAGFDKEARVLTGLERLGFGFLEVGAISSVARPGNPRPRIFRLPDDRGLINRMGLPNAGADVTARRLAALRPRVPVFANIVKTADLEGSLEEMAEDYEKTLRILFPHVSGFTVNISCPASPELRDFGGEEAMARLLGGLRALRDRLAKEQGAPFKPLILKVSPDVEDEERDVIVEAARSGLLDGLVLTNTTTRRPDDLKAPATVTGERGGLSGAPLFPIALAQVRWFAERLEGRVPIIGVGGIDSGEKARQMMDAGADLIEVFTGFIYEGPALIPRIVRAL